MLRPRRESDVRSLFGATPEQIRARQAEANKAFYESQQSGFGRAGAAIGQGLVKLFGAPDKELQEAEQREEAVQKIGALGSLAEQEAAQRGMAPLSMTEPDALAREANRLEAVSTAFRNMGQDTGELDNEVLRLRVEADKAIRARELEDLQRQNIGLQMEKTQFDLDEAWENQPENKRALTLSNQLRDIQIQAAEEGLKNEKAATALEKKGRNQAEAFFKNKKGFEYLAPLVSSGAIKPSEAVDAWVDLSKKPSLDLIEIGNYTTQDGTVVLGAFDKASNKFLQYTPSGWAVVPAGTMEQGRRPADSDDPDAVKGGRSVASSSPQFKSYNRILDTLVDTGLFDLEGQDVDTVNKRLGIDVESTTGKEQLFRLAEIEYNRRLGKGEIITEAEALRSIVSGEAVVEPSETKDSNKPNLTETKVR